MSTDTHPSNLKILLWDIDGTLMTSTRPGAYKRYFGPALERVFGTSGRLADMLVSGMTDFQIAYEALEPEGFTVEDVRARMPDMLEVFPVEMRRILDGEQSHILLDGVTDILGLTAADPVFANGLLTGNLEPAAWIKLEKVGLENRFDYEISAFGDISHDRNDLPFAALERASSKFDFKFDPAQFILIGDTPNDIRAARAFGGKVISVATGRHHTSEELKKFEPDYLLKDLGNTDEVMAIFESI